MAETLFSIITFQAGYNTALVLVGVVLLGLSGGLLGSFLLLRRRILVSDAISHGTLPGVMIAFLLGHFLFEQGRNLPFLLAGAMLAGFFALLAVSAMTRHTRLTEDAAIAVVLSVFFGFGVLLRTLIQSLNLPQQAGLDGVFLGATAGMLYHEALLITLVGSLILIVMLAGFKFFALLCFDPAFAESRGWPVQRLDMVLMLLLLAYVAIGLKAVGLILIVALLVLPAATARLWSRRMTPLVITAALTGGLAAFTGGALSAALPNVPTGPIIVLAAACAFFLSLFIAPQYGLLAGWLRQWHLRHKLIRLQALAALARGDRPATATGYQLVVHQGWITTDDRLSETGLQAWQDAQASLQHYGLTTTHVTSAEENP